MYNVRQTGKASATLVQFVTIARELNNTIDLWVTDYLAYRYFEHLGQSPRHLRSGRIPRDYSPEGSGVGVQAFYTDELGNVTAMLKDGQIRQYI